MGLAMEEIWKPVVGYELRYDVSNLGNVRTSPLSPHPNARPHLGMLLKQRLKKSGYLHVSFKLAGATISRTVHSVVLETFKGNRPLGMVSRHIDGNRKNNSIDNLEWSTQKENIADKIKHGTDNKGERHHNSVLTNQDVVRIRNMKVAGLSNVYIAEAFHVTPANVGDRLEKEGSGKRWRSSSVWCVWWTC